MALRHSGSGEAISPGDQCHPNVTKPNQPMRAIYRVIITNLFGSATSACNADRSGAAVDHPNNPKQTGPEGTNVLSRSSPSHSALTYQWFLNGAVLSGQTNTMLAIPMSRQPMPAVITVVASTGCAAQQSAI